MGQRPEQDIDGAVGAQVVQHCVDPRRGRIEPSVDPLQKVDPGGRGATAGGDGQRRSRCRHQRPEDVPSAAPPVVDLLPGASSPLPTRSGLHEPLAGKAVGALWPHLIETDHDPILRRTGVEGDDSPLFSAKAGSGRSPNQVSCCRQRNPSACKISPMRLRFMAMPLSSLRYAANRSSVQLANGSPSVWGSVRLAAMSSPTSSVVYV